MEFASSIGGRKLPRDSRASAIAFESHLADVGAQLVHALHPARQAGPLEDADLDFRHL
jgi:hypothetical protein